MTTTPQSANLQWFLVNDDRCPSEIGAHITLHEGAASQRRTINAPISRFGALVTNKTCGDRPKRWVEVKVPSDWES